MDHIDVDAYLGGRDGNGLRQLPGTVRTAAVSEMEYSHARSVVLGCFRAVRFSDAIRRKPRTVAVLCLFGADYRGLLLFLAFKCYNPAFCGNVN
ncbi:hypothetical protein D3C76_1051620 [compost metagenome]